ncbi:hypothetical protein O181_022452 [Austropuccinia psidii MF-1]|uniref:Uncharacterized protein n=1 Tax=Austropuccinia psidii MF-1 TaxID=1389203 RepID=A0A9Q3CFH3_9BASI|nr:hypothetical protein [Austropuccinia psidii MF-1]
MKMAPQFGPQSITQDLPCNIGEGQIPWSWKLSTDPGHEGEVKVHGTPGFPEAWSILALGGSSNPHRPRNVKPRPTYSRTHQIPKYLKGPKNTKKGQNTPHHHSIKNFHGNGQDPKYSRGSKWPKNQFSCQISRTMGTTPLLGRFKSPIKMKKAQEDQFPGQTWAFMFILPLLINF